MSKYAEIVQKNILRLVKEKPRLCENYNELIVHYWYTYDDFRKMSEVGKCTPAGTIEREFRELVRMGAIELSEETKKRRRERQAAYQKRFATV